MLVRALVFARLREIVGAADIQRELPPGATVLNLWQALAAEFPELAGYTSAVSCAINAEYARMTTPLNEGDEVAFLPPVSGGSGGRQVGGGSAGRAVG
jgi:molybdopterin converting factor subunit 1